MKTNVAFNTQKGFLMLFLCAALSLQAQSLLLADDSKNAQPDSDVKGKSEGRLIVPVLPDVTTTAPMLTISEPISEQMIQKTVQAVEYRTVANVLEKSDRLLDKILEFKNEKISDNVPENLGFLNIPIPEPVVVPSPNANPAPAVVWHGIGTREPSLGAAFQVTVVDLSTPSGVDAYVDKALGA